MIGVDVSVLLECNAHICSHVLPGLENRSPPREGSDLAGRSSPGACRLPKKLAGGWAEGQSRQPSFSGCSAVQTALRLRPARHSPSHRCEILSETKHVKPEQHVIVVEHGSAHAQSLPTHSQSNLSADPMEAIIVMSCKFSHASWCLPMPQPQPKDTSLSIWRSLLVYLAVLGAKEGKVRIAKRG